MTVGMAAARANSFLDSEYGTMYAQLHTGDPGAAGTANVSAGDATRKQPTMESAASGSKALSSAGGNWTNSGTSETITHLSLWAAATAGTFLRSIAATSSKAWDDGDTIALSSLTISVTPVAD